jgi:hypothetical protein
MTDNIIMPEFLKRQPSKVPDVSPAATAPASGWRSRLKVHPAAEMFPLLPPDELRALADDIKANGLRQKATVWWDGHTPMLLDGRNRLDALELAGMLERAPCGDVAEHLWEPVSNLYPNCEHLEPYALVIGLNIHRRHLSRDQKRDLIAKLLKLKPEKSNREIAATAKVDDKTVAKVRKGMESRSEIPHVEKRTDTKGRKQPAKKASKPTKTESPADARTRQQRERDAELERLRAQDLAAVQERIQQQAKLKPDDDEDVPQPGHSIPPLTRMRDFVHRAKESAEMARADDLSGLTAANFATAGLAVALDGDGVKAEMIAAAQDAVTAWSDALRILAYTTGDA